MLSHQMRISNMDSLTCGTKWKMLHLSWRDPPKPKFRKSSTNTNQKSSKDWTTSSRSSSPRVTELSSPSRTRLSKSSLMLRLLNQALSLNTDSKTGGERSRKLSTNSVRMSKQLSWNRLKRPNQKSWSSWNKWRRLSLMLARRCWSRLSMILSKLSSETKSLSLPVQLKSMDFLICGTKWRMLHPNSRDPPKLKFRKSSTNTNQKSSRD